MRISDWAAARGLHDDDHFAVLDDVLNAASEPDVHTIVLDGGHQTGKSTILRALASWFAWHDASRVLMVLTNQTDATHVLRTFPEQRDPLIRVKGMRHAEHAPPARVVLMDDAERQTEPTLHLLCERTQTFRDPLVVVAGRGRLVDALMRRSDYRVFDGAGWNRQQGASRVVGFDLDSADRARRAAAERTAP